MAGIRDVAKRAGVAACTVWGKGWGAVYLENHDQNLSVNKYLPQEDIHCYSKTMPGSLFFFLRGTPFIYQGQEIRMENMTLESIADYDDIATHGQYERALKAGIREEEAFAIVAKRSRDNNRTPMQWDEGKNAGFSDAESTWMKVNPDYKRISVARQEKDGESVLNFYRKLTGLRRGGKYASVMTYGVLLGHGRGHAP